MKPPYRLRDQARGGDQDRRQRAALVHVRRSLTFGEVDRRADAVAAGLRSAGVGEGDRVALLLPNEPELFELLIGCARAGAVGVPLNWRLAPDELAAVARDAGPRVLVVAERTEHLLPTLRSAGRAVLELRLGDGYERWLARDADDPVPAVGLRDDPDRVVLQVYTSGTSGRPKGVLLTDGNLATKVPAVTPCWGVEETSTTLLATPLFHVGALSWGLVGLHAGATTLLAADASPATLIDHLVTDRVTHTFLVPAMIRPLCEAAGRGPGLSLPHLRAIMYGAAPIDEATQRTAYATFGPVLHHLYGLTETTGAFTELPAVEGVRPGSTRWRSVGRPYPWVEVSVRDPETGVPRAVGEYGEVWTRSGQNTPGYLGLAGDTRALLTADGWLRTGDGGHLDDEGYLFLTTRVKDLIISGGENVFPAEVERVLAAHGAVDEVAVVGVPDRTWGETVAAAVVRRADTTVTAADLVAHAGQRLAGYKRPRLLRFVDELPRNAAGKVLRHRLREQVTRADPEEEPDVE